LGVVSLITFYCIISVCPPLGTGRASIQCRGRILPNRRRCPLSLLSLGGTGPMWSTQNGVQRAGIRTRASVRTSER
jgi:hypothetical protein